MATTDSVRLAELELIKNRKFTATGAITAGDRVSLLSDGTVSVTSSSNVANYLGIAAENIANGATGKILLIANLAGNQSGLTVNTYYYVASDGSLSQSASSNSLVGRAVSATEIFLTNEVHAPLVHYGASGADTMIAGGATSTPSLTRLNTVDLKQFASTATAVDHGDLSTTRYQAAAGSDGSQLLVMGGRQHSPNVLLSSAELKSFSSNAIGTSHGSIQNARNSMGAGSDGTQVMMGGGAPTTNQCEMKQFASSAVATLHGLLSVAKYALTGCSDSTEVMFTGGGTTNITDKKQFASTATAVAHGGLSVSRYGEGEGSNGSDAMFCGGYSTTETNVCDLTSFASSATAVDIGDLSVARLDLKGSSDGTNVMICGGLIFSTTTTVNTCDLKSFTSTATAVDNGDLSQARYGVVSGSGN